MLLSEAITILHAKRLVGPQDYDCHIEMACGADLMSDVLSFAKEGALLLTGLTAPQVVQTATIADIKLICFVRGKTPPDETLRLAASRNLVLLTTRLPMFESCGRLYQAGLRGCSENGNADALPPKKYETGSRAG